MMRLRSGAMSAQMWHLCAFILICLWHVAFAYAEQNESPVPRNISINLQGASPYQVLDALAKEIGKGWIAGELPDKKYDVRIVQAPPLEAIINVADALGIQLELWRGLLIAEPASPGNSLRDKLRQALPKDVAELLLRPPDNGSIAAPGFELVLNAIKALYRHDNSPNGHSAVLKAAYWMAAPELRTIIIPYDSACDGTAVIRMLPRSHWVHWLREPELDTCQYHMVFGIPATGLDEPPNRPIAFHERGYDYFAELLRKEKGLISVAEYKRRIVNACRKRDDPISKIANVMESISINGNGIPLGELGRQIAQMTKVNVKVSDALATKRVWLNVKDAITADVLLATARVAGGVWALSNDMKGCEIDVPRITLEQLDTALPLIMWCPAHLTAAEANMVRQDYINAFFDALPEELVNELKERPIRVSKLPSMARKLLIRLIAVESGGRYAFWTHNLPLRDGIVPMWLLQDEKRCMFELATPGISEFVAGHLYLKLITELLQQPFLIVEAASKKHQQAAP